MENILLDYNDVENLMMNRLRLVHERDKGYNSEYEYSFTVLELEEINKYIKININKLNSNNLKNLVLKIGNEVSSISNELSDYETNYLVECYRTDLAAIRERKSLISAKGGDLMEHVSSLVKNVSSFFKGPNESTNIKETVADQIVMSEVDLANQISIRKLIDIFKNEFELGDGGFIDYVKDDIDKNLKLLSFDSREDFCKMLFNELKQTIDIIMKRDLTSCLEELQKNDMHLDKDAESIKECYKDHIKGQYEFLVNQYDNLGFTFDIKDRQYELREKVDSFILRDVTSGQKFELDNYKQLLTCDCFNFFKSGGQSEEQYKAFVEGIFKYNNSENKVLNFMGQSSWNGYSGLNVDYNPADERLFVKGYFNCLGVNYQYDECNIDLLYKDLTSGVENIDKNAKEAINKLLLDRVYPESSIEHDGIQFDSHKYPLFPSEEAKREISLLLKLNDSLSGHNNTLSLNGLSDFKRNRYFMINDGTMQDPTSNAKIYKGDELKNVDFNPEHLYSIPKDDYECRQRSLMTVGLLNAVNDDNAKYFYSALSRFDPEGEVILSMAYNTLDISDKEFYSNYAIEDSLGQFEMMDGHKQVPYVEAMKFGNPDYTTQGTSEFIGKASDLNVDNNHRMIEFSELVFRSEGLDVTQYLKENFVNQLNAKIQQGTLNCYDAYKASIHMESSLEIIKNVAPFDELRELFQSDSICSTVNCDFVYDDKFFEWEAEIGSGIINCERNLGIEV